MRIIIIISWDLRSVISFDKLMSTSMCAWNLEISNTSGDMDCVICHFESGGLGVFFVTVLVVCPEIFFAIGGGCKSTTITVTLRRHTWRQLHCGHLLSLAVIHNSNFHLGNVNLELMKSLNNRGRSGHQLDFRDDVNEVWCLGRQHEFLDIGTLPLMKRMRKCQLQLIQGDWKHH